MRYSSKRFDFGGSIMSSLYPSPAQPCQRCGRPLPPNEAYCGNCGLYNTPAPVNNFAAQSPVGPGGMPWSGATAPTPYGANQSGGQQPHTFDEAVVPQRPFHLP